MGGNIFVFICLKQIFSGRNKIFEGTVPKSPLSVATGLCWFQVTHELPTTAKQFPSLVSFAQGGLVVPSPPDSLHQRELADVPACACCH